MRTKYLYLGMEFTVCQDRSICSAPSEFWSNHYQWKHEGLVTYKHYKCWNHTDILVTDKFLSGAIPA